MADAWHRAYGRERIDIPCGVVATLALWPHKSDGAAHARDLGDYLSSQPSHRWPPTVGQVASAHWLRRPDLISAAGPMLRWYTEELTDDALYAIKAVADTAIKHGVLLHTGDTNPYMRSQIDVMSWTLVRLRHLGGGSMLAEFHTPDDAAETLVRLVLGEDPPASGSLHEPTGGRAPSSGRSPSTCVSVASTRATGPGACRTWTRSPSPAPRSTSWCGNSEPPPMSSAATPCPRAT